MQLQTNRAPQNIFTEYILAAEFQAYYLFPKFLSRNVSSASMSFRCKILKLHRRLISFLVRLQHKEQSAVMQKQTGCFAMNQLAALCRSTSFRQLQDEENFPFPGILFLIQVSGTHRPILL